MPKGKGLWFIGPLIPQAYNINKGLVPNYGEGGLQNGRGVACKVLLLIKRGGRKKALAMLKGGGHKKFGLKF